MTQKTSKPWGFVPSPPAYMPKPAPAPAVTLEERHCKCGCGAKFKVMPTSKQEYSSKKCEMGLTTTVGR